MWPWFGARDGYPQHGFVRTLPWELVQAESLDEQQTKIVLALSDSVVTRKIWPHSFDLRLEILVGAELELKLTARNTGSETIETGGGFHPYFRVGDIRAISVRGLAGLEYLDKVADYALLRRSMPSTTCVLLNRARHIRSRRQYRRSCGSRSCTILF